MAIGVKNQYYCPNLKGCKYAKRYYVYSKEKYTINSTCIGVANDGCGSELIADHKDYRVKAIVLLICLLISASFIGVSVKQRIFPEPITGVDFALLDTHLEEGVGTVLINVERDSDLDKKLTIVYETVGRQAIGNMDFIEQTGQIIFEPGDKSAQIPITILKDKEYEENEEHFLIVLKNVLGKPSHNIFILENAGDPSIKAQVNALVKSTSVIALDIAQLAMRISVNQEIIDGIRHDASLYSQYSSTLETQRANLRRARERYLELLREMTNQPTASILISMEEHAAELDERDYPQQALATRVMKMHFQTYLEKENPRMDEWQYELHKELRRLIEGPSNHKSA